MDDYRGEVGFLPIQMLEVEIHQSTTVRALSFFFAAC